MWGMPQSSRTMVTFRACRCQRATSGSAAGFGPAAGWAPAVDVARTTRSRASFFMGRPLPWRRPRLWLPRPRSLEGAPGQGARVLAVLQHLDAVHEDVAHAGRVLVR